MTGRSWTVRSTRPIGGAVVLPGDKSISHRALLINALGEGEATVRGLNPGADLASTRAALQGLGVRIDGNDEVHLHGRSGRLRPVVDVIDCGNSGTTIRLLAGILAAQPFTTTLDGDGSLRARPMSRIGDPLRRMGARVEGPDGGRHAPLILTGGELTGGEFSLPAASAQVKSCILLAAATAGIGVRVESPGASRDHTERMLAAMGAPLEWSPTSARLEPTESLRCVDVAVPGDPSAAALVAVAVAPVPGAQVRFENVLVNPTRAAFLGVLERMGMHIERRNQRESGGEPVADLLMTAPTELRGAVISNDEIPGLVDEVPALAVVAAFATGPTRFEGVAELRVKESDRVQSVRNLLGAMGVGTTDENEVLTVMGGSPSVEDVLPGGDDHRMAMAASAAAAACSARDPRARPRVADVDSVAVSFPHFDEALQGLGFHVES